MAEYSSYSMRTAHNAKYMTVFSCFCRLASPLIQTNTEKLRTIKTRAPPPEARRAEERGRTPRRTPPIFTRAALPEGHRPAWVPRPLAEAEASASRPRRESGSEFHPQPRQRRGQPPPAQAAPSRVSGGAVAEAGAAIPERRAAERGSA